MGPPRRPARRGRARPPLHRPPPGPRGHVAAGVRRPPAGRAHRAPARPHRRHDGPQRARPSDIDLPVARPDLGASRWRCCAANCAEFGIRLYAMGEPGQGIVHVIGPEQGLTQPGMTIVCGDSHTSTHGAFGALAFGIGTSEVEHVLATQTLPQARPGTMAVTVDGELPRRRHRQGHRARDHRPHRHRRRHRLDHRVPRLGDPRAVDGRADDRLQHVDRGRRACRAWSRPTTPRSRTSRAASSRRRATAWDAARRRLALARHRRRRRRSTRRSCSTPPRCGRTVTWGTNPAQSVTIDDVGAEPRLVRRRRRARQRASGRSPTWGCRRARRSATSPSTPCSSARAPTRASRTCAPPPRSSRGPARCSDGVRTLVVPGLDAR